MNQLEAMRDTVALMESQLRRLRVRSQDFPSELRPDHLREMLATMESGINPQDTEKGFSDGKMGRWLGWAQASVVALGLATLDDMRAINRKHMSAPHPQQ